jgi:transposase
MQQRHLSLAQRAEVLRERLNIPKLSAMTVWRCYQEFGAKYVKPKIVYRSKNERQQELCGLQQQFSQEILDLIMHSPETETVYIDETTFNLWQSPSRVWLKEGMRIELPNQRGVSITMIGAISTMRGFFHTCTFAATNTQDTFLPFLFKLREKCWGHRTVVVMDNLQVHKTKVVRDAFNSGFQQKFLPPQSCELNPIEKAWNIIKGQWRKRSYLILENNRSTDDKVRDAVDMIQGLAEGADQDAMKKVALSNYKSMSLTLRGLLV